MIKFIDLFAGIGGFHFALKQQGMTCVFSAENNLNACEIYNLNYGINPFCNVSLLDTNQIPDFDILCAGFPCQAFSIAGKQKGFNDTRGTLFFEIAKILNNKKPSAFILENVSQLLYHDNGRTFETILNVLKNLNYTVSHQVLNASDFGVGQSRKRLIVVGIKKEINKTFDFSNLHIKKEHHIKNILETNIEHNYLIKKDYTLLENTTTSKDGLIFAGYLNKKTRLNGAREGAVHLSRNHRQCNRIYSVEGLHPTISSQDSSGRYYILDNNGVRKLTILECFRLMGYPDDFIKVGAKSMLYNRIGNSVCIPMISEIANKLKRMLYE